MLTERSGAWEHERMTSSWMFIIFSRSNLDVLLHVLISKKARYVRPQATCFHEYYDHVKLDCLSPLQAPSVVCLLCNQVLEFVTLDTSSVLFLENLSLECSLIWSLCSYCILLTLLYVPSSSLNVDWIKFDAKTIIPSWEWRDEESKTRLVASKR